MGSLLTLEHARPTFTAGVCARVVTGGEMRTRNSSDALGSLFAGLYTMPTKVQPTHIDPLGGGGGAGS